MTRPGIYWVAAALGGRLAVVSRPRGLEDLTILRTAGIDVLVSLLENEEAREVGLADEAALCERAGIDFVALPIVDHGIPQSFETMERAIAELAGHLANGRNVGAHCYAGLGRSPLLVAALLIHHGLPDHAAIKLVSAARGHDVPEMEHQHAWLRELALRRLR
jgi:protein-tyrosine phosphatase